MTETGNHQTLLLLATEDLDKVLPSTLLDGFKQE
jgi:hypothetical protein